MLFFRGVVCFVARKTSNGLYEFYNHEFEGIGNAIAIYSDIIMAEQVANELDEGYKAHVINDDAVIFDILDIEEKRGITHVAIDPGETTSYCTSIGQFKEHFRKAP